VTRRDGCGQEVLADRLHTGQALCQVRGGNKKKPLEVPDLEKSRAAEIFYEMWWVATEDEEYLKVKEEHRRRNP
jgi:hypothetical protein